MAARPSFLFAHGAGAPSSSAWMVAWRKRMATLGDVTAFDYPYMRAGRKAPDRLPVLIDAHRAVLVKVRARAKGPLFLAGKSMGGRVGCHLALEEPVAGVICLGYPLQSRGYRTALPAGTHRGGLGTLRGSQPESSATGALRDEVLLALRVPILFVQGSRDSLCPLDKLAEVRARMNAPSTLLVVEGGNHSLEVSAAQRKATGDTQAASDARVLEAIRAFTQPTR